MSCPVATWIQLPVVYVSFTYMQKRPLRESLEEKLLVFYSLSKRIMGYNVSDSVYSNIIAASRSYLRKMLQARRIGQVGTRHELTTRFWQNFACGCNHRCHSSNTVHILTILGVNFRRFSAYITISVTPLWKGWLTDKNFGRQTEGGKTVRETQKVDITIILKWILKKTCAKVRTRFLRFITETRGGLLWTRQWIARFHKEPQVSWLPELLVASQERQPRGVSTVNVSESDV